MAIVKLTPEIEDLLELENKIIDERDIVFINELYKDGKIKDYQILDISIKSVPFKMIPYGNVKEIMRFLFHNNRSKFYDILRKLIYDDQLYEDTKTIYKEYLERQIREAISEDMSLTLSDEYALELYTFAENDKFVINLLEEHKYFKNNKKDHFVIIMLYPYKYDFAKFALLYLLENTVEEFHYYERINKYFNIEDVFKDLKEDGYISEELELFFNTYVI